MSLKDSISRGIAWLMAHQSAGGEFPAYASLSPDMSGWDVWADKCVFATASVALALRGIDDAGVAAMERRACAFLLGEMTGNGVWSYWSQASGKMISPDLDDTAICTAVFRRRHPVIAEGNKAVFLANRNPDGSFRTWIRSPDQPNDVDCVVNANVLFVLGEDDSTAAAGRMLVDIVSDGREMATTHYYCHPVALHYAMARAFQSGVTGFAQIAGVACARILAFRDELGGFGDALNTAFGLNALIGYGHADDRVLASAANRLRDLQYSDGSWPRLPFYTGPEPPAVRSVWFGSEAVVTAFCVEALAAYGGAMVVGS